MYSKVQEMARCIESTLTLEMLFLACYQYTLMYMRVSDVYLSEIETDPILQIPRWLQNMHIFFFLAMVLAASEAHSRDASLRWKMKNRAFQMSLHTTTPSQAEVIYKLVDSKPPIVFTAWKMCSFTRKFILTSIGMLLTYSFLILQLDGDKPKTSEKQNQTFIDIVNTKSLH